MFSSIYIGVSSVDSVCVSISSPISGCCRFSYFDICVCCQQPWMRRMSSELVIMCHRCVTRSRMEGCRPMIEGACITPGRIAHSWPEWPTITYCLCTATPSGGSHDITAWRVAEWVNILSTVPCGYHVCVIHNQVVWLSQWLADEAHYVNQVFFPVCHRAVAT